MGHPPKYKYGEKVIYKNRICTISSYMCHDAIFYDLTNNTHWYSIDLNYPIKLPGESNFDEYAMVSENELSPVGNPPEKTKKLFLRLHHPNNDLALYFHDTKDDGDEGYYAARVLGEEYDGDDWKSILDAAIKLLEKAKKDMEAKNEL